MSSTLWLVIAPRNEVRRVGAGTFKHHRQYLAAAVGGMYPHSHVDNVLQMKRLLLEWIRGEGRIEQQKPVREAVLSQPRRHHSLLHVWTSGQVQNHLALKVWHTRASDEG